MKTFTIKSNGKRFFAENNETFDYENIESLESVSTMDLHKILTDRVNRDILEDLKIIDNKGQNILFEVSEKGNLILRCENEEKEINSSILEITVTTLYGDSREIKRFDPKNDMLSKEVINNKDNSRKYTEFHKSGNIELEMQAGNDGKQNYTLIRYDNKNNIKETKTFSEENSDFETIKNDNILGHKKKFTLGKKYRAEKDFRDFGIVTNINDIRCFTDSASSIVDREEIENALRKEFGDNYNKPGISPELDEKVNDFRKVFILNKAIKFIISNLSTLKKIRRELLIFPPFQNQAVYLVGNYNSGSNELSGNFIIKEARQYDDNDKLNVKVNEDGTVKLMHGDNMLEPGRKYYFTAPNRDGNIYLFDDENGEHHSNFPLNEGKNPNFSIVAGGCFIVGEDGKIAKIVNDSGHFQPLAKDNYESFLRILAKNMFSALIKEKCEIKNRSVIELVGLPVSVDITKCGGVAERKCITMNSKEPEEATTIISKRRLNLIDRNAQNSVIGRGI